MKYNIVISGADKLTGVPVCDLSFSPPLGELAEEAMREYLLGHTAVGDHRPIATAVIVDEQITDRTMYHMTIAPMPTQGAENPEQIGYPQPQAIGAFVIGAVNSLGHEGDIAITPRDWS